MPKKQLLYLALIILMAALIWFLSSDSKSTISFENNFAISDTASVSKIFIADRNGTTITLNRNEKNWVINNKYEVRKDAINTILTTINQIRIQKKVSKTINLDHISVFNMPTNFDSYLRPKNLRTGRSPQSLELAPGIIYQ